MPTWVGSRTHFQVYSRSAVVNGSPSDHLRFGRSSTSTSKPVPSASTRMELSPKAGILAARSGFQWPSDVTSQRPRIVAAYTWLFAKALLNHGFSWLAACQSLMITLPPGVPVLGSYL